MDLSNYRRMDPNLLYGIVNMKLRNDYRDLEDLTLGLNLDKAVLEQRLAEGGFAYDANLRQFR